LSKKQCSIPGLYTNENTARIQFAMRLTSTILKGLLTTTLLVVAPHLHAQAPAGPTSEREADPLGVDTTSRSFPIMYAFYSPAWSVSSNAGLRLVVENRSSSALTLQSIEFRGDVQSSVNIELSLPAGNWAETELPYIDLLGGNECINNTLQDRWRLMEISNYTLNPSVRGLIIEDTVSFRIFQCVRPVRLTVLDEAGQAHEENLWVMYHFERLPLE